jgi:indolepyruvate ferredoxin oxidoreductase alpha subunit
MERLTAESNRAPENRIEMRDASLGIITSGVAYQYVREALPDASVLKLGMPFPLPEDLMRTFAAQVATVAIVEELEPFIALRAEPSASSC